MQQLDYDVEHPDSIFARFSIDSPMLLSEIVKELGWGGNKLIRSGGIKMSPSIVLLKHWKTANDPRFIIDKKTYLTKGKGRTVVVINMEGN